MKTSRLLIAVGACAASASPAHALLSVNVTQDYTTVPGWVVNTFTVDTDTDMTVAVAYSQLSSGSMLNLPGLYPETRSNGPGDSYFSINNDHSTIGWLGYGDLVGGAPSAFFDENGIGMAWLNIKTTDIGSDLHLMTLTFSTDTSGILDFKIGSSANRLSQGAFDITAGAASLESFSYYEPPPPDPDPDPDPDPGSGGGTNPGTGGGTNPGGGTGPIPEPAWLGVMGVGAAMLGALHRRRLWI